MQTDGQEEKEQKMTDKERAIQALLGNKSSFLRKKEIDCIWNSAFHIENGNNLSPIIIPIIYIPDPSKHPSDTIWQCIDRNIELSIKFNFHGVILTNHGFMCKDLIPIIDHCRAKYPNLWIGLKLIGTLRGALGFLIHRSLLNKVNGLWIEEGGVTFDHSSDVIKHSKASQRLANYRQIQSEWMSGNGLIFGGVEYEYDTESSESTDAPPDYDKLCRKLSGFAAKGFMHCITTSADEKRHEIGKSQYFKEGIKGKCKFAISDGVDIDNLSRYLSLGVDAIFPNRIFCDEENRHNFNEFKMSRFRNCITNFYGDQNGQCTLDDVDDQMDGQNGLSGLSPVVEEQENTKKKPLSPVDEEMDFETKQEDAIDVVMTDMSGTARDEEVVYQVHIGNANDVNGDLNGLYHMELDEDKLPRIQHQSADIVFTPNFMYFMRSISTHKEYAIFIIPSLEVMSIHKPTWVVAQINVDPQNTMVNSEDITKGQQPIYYYAAEVDFTRQNAMQIPPEKSSGINRGKWLIVGDDGSSAVTMTLKVITLKSLDERRRNFSAMHSLKNKQFLKKQIAAAKEEAAVKAAKEKAAVEEFLKDEVMNDTKEKEQDPHQYDVDDHKVTTVEEVGHDNILRVTDDLKELKREWTESELGDHDELEMFLGAVGKVVGIEEDDDSVKLEWCNQDCHWLPVKACWIQWRDLTLTAPNFYPDQEDGNDDSKLISDVYGGSAPQ